MGYESGDRVLVYKSTKTRDNREVDYQICSVVFVGIYDLICETLGMFPRSFKISKKRCVKIEMLEFLPDKALPVKPKIGDLVLSVKDKFGKEREEVTGIVESIIYDPITNHDQIYIIRTGNQTVSVLLENIIIIESAE